ncbi:hypothetical protein cyc_00423 [Cyclospora cayetanensis]|uniref:Uncharacterized protein n=1 Tax=Cyclospora cayetanensis TaxID=88456 RepID=A0A1D3D3F6_9EIME|nr:hypothetical protein cyc_00423 [Cyclospora cayetanensis]
MAENQRLLVDSQEYVNSLEAKFEEIRGDPDAVRDTVQRVDLMYAQIDTLIQAFAGVCSFVATRDADRPTILQCVLDYLYPCRSLDPRLNALYGALYYYRLGEYKGLPDQPPPPPEPKFIPMHEVMGPWIQPTPFTPHPTPPVHATKFDAGLAATIEASKAPEVTKADSKPKGLAVDGQKAKEASLVAKAGAAGVKAATGPRSKASLPQQAADASADVELKGMSILLEELTGFKRPAMSRGVGVKLVVRFDHESAVEMKKKPDRCVVIDKCDGSAGNESASVYFLAELSPMPPKKPGILPKIYIDVFDEKSPNGLGNAQKTISEADTIKKSAPWQIKDTRGAVLGSISVSIAPVPLNAMLPAQARKATGKVAGEGALKKGEKAEPQKPDVPKSVSTSGVGAKPELPKPAVSVSKPPLPTSPTSPAKPDLPKPGAPVTKPELPKPGLAAKPDIPKPALGAKPDLPKPGALGAKPDLPKPGITEIKKPDIPKPGLGLTKPDLSKPESVPSKPGLSKPGAAAEKPGPPKPEGVPGAADAKKTLSAAAAKPELGKPGSPSGTPSPMKGPGAKPDSTKAATGGPGAKDFKAAGPPKPADTDGKSKGGPAAPAKGEAPAKPGLGTPQPKADVKKSLLGTAGGSPKPGLDAKPQLGAKPNLAAKPALAKPDLGAKPALKKPDLGAKPAVAKPALAAKPGLAKPALAKPAVPAKPMLALAKGPAKPATPAKPMLALAKGSPAGKPALEAKPALGAKPATPAKPALSKPGMPPAKAGLGKAP